MDADTARAGQVTALLTGSSNPMVATEGSGHLVKHANSAFCSLLGLDTGRIVGRPVGELLRECHDCRDPAAMALLDLVYSTGTPEFGVDLGRVFGTEAPVRLPSIIWPILGSDVRPGGLLIRVGAPTRWMSTPAVPAPVVRVDRPSPNTELRQANEQLLLAGLEAQEHADALATLRDVAEAALSMRDEFISIAAHELRTPVTAIKVSAQLAQRSLTDAVPDTARISKYLAGIVDGANRLTSLTNDLMDVSRMRTGSLLLRLAPVDLAALVNTVALRYADTGVEGHHVMISVPHQPLMIQADSGRVEQILDNVLSNAVKYSPDGGNIFVTLLERPDGIVLTASDDGIGLMPDAHEHIFEPFGRGENAKRHGLPGMGLGLHICRLIAEAHGGRMWAESDGEGKGTTVGLWLPPPTLAPPVEAC